MNLLIKGLDELDSAAQKIIQFASDKKIFLFYGDMGAGKTTLIKAICHHLGTTDNVSSPTFAIVNEYSITNSVIYHFDLYRLKYQYEAMDLGFEEYLHSGKYCFIEWPEKIPDLLPEHYVSIKIQAADDNSRRVSITNI